MKLVADANILFSLIKPNTSASQLIKTANIKIFSPSFALGELAKHKFEIEKKSGISLKKIRELLKQQVLFVNESKYLKLFPQFKDFIDENDVPYLALSASFKIPIWSNDPHLKQQSIVKVLTTKELIDLL